MVGVLLLPMLVLCGSTWYIIGSTWYIIGSTWYIIGSTLKTPPAVLMKGGDLKNKVNFLERRLGLERFSFSFKFQIREQVRSLSRTFFLLFGVYAVGFCGGDGHL